jgi:Zn finger protein HypA/HybF involved in hydrogenase expression
MHEVHLMRQVVQAVMAELQEAAQAKPILVRLKIRASSHLLAQDPSALHAAFALASQGSKTEGAKLDIIPFSGDAWCPRCKTDRTATDSDGLCVTCGGPVLAGEAAPEMVVHELVVEE